MFFGPRDTSDLISMVSFTFSTRRCLIRLASAILNLLPFGKVWLDSVCRLQHLATKQKTEFTELGENVGTILTRLWTKVHEIFQTM